MPHAYIFLYTSYKTQGYIRDGICHAGKRTICYNGVVHISLNFHESDKLTKEKLCAIAESYMEGIGFEKQPYLVYLHEDAGHPHIHIVSTNIQKDGNKIEMHNIGRNQSEVARKLIEQVFRLTLAEGRGKKQQHDQEDQLKASVQKVQYGKRPQRELSRMCWML